MRLNHPLNSGKEYPIRGRHAIAGSLLSRGRRHSKCRMQREDIEWLTTQTRMPEQASTRNFRR